VAVLPRTGAGHERRAEQSRAAFPTRSQVGALITLGAVFLIALAPRLDTDLWWHLQDGMYVATRHAVATRDYLSFTFSGRPWTDHEWLSDLLLYACYRAGGLWGTIVAFAVVICSTFALVYVRMVRGGAHPLFCLFVLLAACVSSSATWGARPQMLTLLFLAVFALVLDLWIQSRDRKLVFLFPALSVLWTNLHGGWVLGLALLVLTFIGELVNRASGHAEAPDARELRWLAGTIGLTVFAAAINPAGLREVVYPLVWLAPTAYSNMLTEWVSSDFHQPVVMVFEVLLLAFVATFFILRPRLNWTHLLTFLAFTYLALGQSRNVAVWSVLMSPVLAVYLQKALPAPSPARQKSSRRLSPRSERSINVALLLVTSALYAVEALHFISPAALRMGERGQYPAAATAYMAAHHLPSRTFASYAWGGYVLWKLYPRYRDFIDGRANTLFDTALLNDYVAAADAAPGWQDVLSRWKVGTVLIEPASALSAALSEDRGWKRAYGDTTAVVYVRLPRVHP